MLTRKVCAACRLTKCLAVGMSPYLIRKEAQTGTKRKSIELDQQELALAVHRSHSLSDTRLRRSSRLDPSTGIRSGLTA